MKGKSSFKVHFNSNQHFCRGEGFIQSLKLRFSVNDKIVIFCVNQFFAKLALCAQLGVQ